MTQTTVAEMRASFVKLTEDHLRENIKDGEERFAARLGRGGGLGLAPLYREGGIAWEQHTDEDCEIILGFLRGRLRAMDKTP